MSVLRGLLHVVELLRGPRTVQTQLRVPTHYGAAAASPVAGEAVVRNQDRAAHHVEPEAQRQPTKAERKRARRARDVEVAPAAAFANATPRVALTPDIAPPSRALVAAAPVFELCAFTKVHGTGGGRVVVFDAIDCVAPASGGILGIEGPSGAGKSTLIKCLAGFDIPTQGSVRVFGAKLPRDARALAEHRRRVGTVLQSKNLIDHLSASGNVAVPLALHGMPWRDAQKKADHWLDVLGLRDCAGRKPAQLSGGQQQRVAIARALAGSARLILADEPTSMLDATNARQVLCTLRIAARVFDTAVVLVSHDASVLAVCDHVLRCDGGTLTRVAAHEPQGVAPRARRDPLFPV